ncbi:glycosyltransferase family 39 protein [Amycolatopsis sp. NPDC059657]|uniref:glycosyltransferase family 39 protein n=1 Tax=Amycolatopsis sp. NPDC059657 TaxID=3346899 RepID=UPI00366DE951
MDEELPRFEGGLVGAFVAVQVVVLTALSGGYGFHRDELYFVAAGDRLAWGYVDQPPLTPWLARIATDVFGSDPAGLRVIATLAGAMTVVLAAFIARELGGGRGPQLLAAATTALSAFVLLMSHMVSTNTVDMVIWLLIGLLAIRLLRTGDGRWWLPLGLASGIGLTNKWLVLLLLFALGIAVLAVGPRSVFRSAWLAAGMGIAVVIAAPSFIWQAVHGFPLLTVAEGISRDDGTENRLTFVPLQLVYLSPMLVPVWLSGLVRLWRTPKLRAVALSYPVLCVVLLLIGGKPYYSVPLLILLTAAGAEPILGWIDRRSRVIIAAVLAVAALPGSLLIGLPIVPASSLAGPIMALNKEQGEQVGWPGFTATVAHAWEQIPPGQRSGAVIFTSNYGQAAAVERYGGNFGLPQPYSGHMSYYDWGPPSDTKTGPVLLVGFAEEAAARRGFRDCRVVAVHDNGLGLDNDEQGTRIALCARPPKPWSQVWPDLRVYY